MSKIKIVLIEDDEVLARVLYAELTDAGFEVRQAFDGEAGLRMVGSAKPDLILLDMIIPKKSGFQVLVELKKSVDTAHIPVIILTMLGGDEDLRGLQLGADGYIVKSQHEVAEIVEKVKSFLAKKNQ